MRTLAFIVLFFFSSTNARQPQSQLISRNTEDGVTDNMTVDDSTRMNQLWTDHDVDTIVQKTCIYEGVRKPYGWCQHSGLSTSNKYKIMVIGNSWVANHGKIIYEECGKKANTLIQGSAYGCEPLYPTPAGGLECANNFTDFAQRVEKYKPDYVLHITRQISYGNEPFTDSNDDAIYQTMLTQLNKLTKFIKNKIYILDAIPRINYGPVYTLAQYIKDKKPLDELDKVMVDFTTYYAARKRYARLFKDCGSKCEQIDYHNAFYKNTTGTFRFYDERGFSYFTANNHVTPHGLEHVRSIYRNICDKL